MIKDISFIIIAKNESFGVNKCLNSLVQMHLKNCEVICIDSDSFDNTIEVMKSYTNLIDKIKIVKCMGDVSAPIARNIGLKYASKKYIFFVDGDVELYSNFINESLLRMENNYVDAVTGKLLEIQYDAGYKKKLKTYVRREFMKKEKKCFMTGGIFIAKKAIIDRVGKWNTNFIRLQDFEYTLRISKIGTLIQLPLLIGVHHTQEYRERSWEHFKKNYHKYYGLLIRKHLDSPKIIFSLLKSNRSFTTFLILLNLIFIIFVFVCASYISIKKGILLCSFFIFTDFIYSVIIKKQKIIMWLLYNYLIPPKMLSGFFLRQHLNRKNTIVKIIY